MRWGWILAVTFYGIHTSLWCWAEPLSPIPLTPSTTEQQVKDEVLSLKEETVSITSRYEQPISQAPSDVYVITDEDIRHSVATDLPTVLRGIHGSEVMQVTGVDFNVSMRADNQLGPAHS